MEEVNTANKRLKLSLDNHERDLKEQITELDDIESKLNERMDELNKKKQQIAETNGSTNISGDDLIEINAGGKVIAAKRSTLTQLNGTRLEALFSGRWEKELLRDSQGRIFLDVNPKCFQSIVDYLTELSISSEDNLPKLPSVDDDYNDAMKHQIELFNLFRGLPLSDIVKDKRHIDQLHDWLKEDGSDGELSLLYRGSRDGIDGKDFHSKCNRRGSTLTIIQTTSGIIIGGYANTEWKSLTGNSRYLKANKSFLFVLSGINNGNISPPYKMKLKDPNDCNATYHNNDYGPTFGNGTDLYVFDGSVTLNVGNTYRGSIEGKHTIKEIEVYEVECKVTQDGKPSAAVSKVMRFSEDINNSINAKIKTLTELESEMQHLEESFNDEQTFITSFTSGGTKDIVTLNVSGTTMVTKRATLCSVEESSLAQQFDDTKWTEQGSSTNRVKAWTPNEVCDWATKIDDISDEVAHIFVENEITGNELLALNIDGLKMIGIERAGTVCLLLKEIKSLEKASQDVVTLIEHSPYCFGKILDYLRMKQIHSEGLVSKTPPLPRVWDSQKEKFRKVVQYFFPGDCAKLILGD